MQKVYIINKMDITPFGPDTPEIIGITLDVNDVYTIINEYIHSRIYSTFNGENEHEMQAAEHIWTTVQGYDYGVLEVKQKLYAGYDNYGIEVVAHELYQSSESLR